MQSNNSEQKFVAITVSKISNFDILSSEVKNNLFAIINSRILKQNGIKLSFNGNILISYFSDSSDAVNFAIDLDSRISKYNIENNLNLSLSTAIDFGEVIISENNFSGQVLENVNFISTFTPNNFIYFTSQIKNKIKYRLNLEIASVPSNNQFATELFSIEPQIVSNKLEAALKNLNQEQSQRKINQIISGKSLFKRKISPIQLFSIIIILIAILKILGIW